MEVKISQIAKIYADSLIDLDDDKASMQSEFKQIVESFTDELYSTLENASLPSDLKISILSDVFKGKINYKLFEFLKILTNKGRVGLIPQIYEAYVQKCNMIDNIQAIKIISAIELDESYKNKIIDKLKEKAQKEIEAEWLVSEDIIAGLVIKIGDTVIDTSLKNKLEQLNKQI